MGNKDKDMDNDEFLRRMKAHLKSTASRGNMRGVDPDLLKSNVTKRKLKNFYMSG